MSLLGQTPQLEVSAATELARKLYGVQSIAPTQPLASERDQNFLIETADGQFVLKLSNAAESHENLVAQNELIERISSQDFGAEFQSVHVVESLQGELIESTKVNGKEHWVRLVTFVPGQTMSSVPCYSNGLLRHLGSTVGHMNEAFEGFDHSAFHREFHWDLAQCESVIESRLDHVTCELMRSHVQQLLARFKQHTQPLLSRLPQSVIHNDANDGNLIVQAADDSCVPNQIVGVIDFGDAVWSWTVGELAIAIAYAVLDHNDPVAAMCQVIDGYQDVRQLTDAEASALFGLICMRLCVSVVMAAEQQSQRPDDPYLSISQAPIARTLPLLVDVPFRFAETLIRARCGLESLPKSKRVCDWLNRQSGFVFPTGEGRPSDDELLVMDLGVKSPYLAGGPEGVSLPVATKAIDSAMEEASAKVGVGRYLEPRLLYQSGLFVSKSCEQEDRTIHLGIDLFDEAGTVVRAPLDGEVFLFNDNDSALDYGPVIILKHDMDGGESFYSLYGHLARTSLDGLEIGQKVSTGEVFATLGAPNENGGWPPHLHFQLIVDLLDVGIDFAGVCRPSRMSTWRKFSPDPNLVLRIAEEKFPRQVDPKATTLEHRSNRMGGNVSIGYHRPLKAERGWMQYLYDENGQKYIDAYNNVPHVGHCHPKVVKALHAQARRLNTNTRYLSDEVLAYADALTATMPEGLDVCYFLNSASEANELALRMARAKTGGKDLIVLDGAYHGHSTNLIDISPYKHDGPGGSGGVDWVHKAPVADVYRGEFRDWETAGENYAAELGRVVDRLVAEDKQLSGFIAESCPSVGGQIMFPPEYLKNVYQKIRAAGGLCIADDVQTGYGRLGKWFYGFEQQNVVPDIVVLGKPIGNGHPIAALVTTRQIADSFDNGMEFFSTFGGNNVSAVVGKTVLDVVQEEELAEHAKNVGGFLLSGLRELQQNYSLIGDVRGSGFFLGVELVRDHDTLEPATREASFIANRMRSRRVLLGTDGPLHNVIKIRPPMPFDLGDAKELLRALGETFAELESN